MEEAEKEAFTVTYDGPALDEHLISAHALAQSLLALDVSYQKARRLCRHYLRASKDPALALAWLTGDESKPMGEPKTDRYYEDLERSYARQEKFKDRLVGKAVDRLSGEIK